MIQQRDGEAAAHRAERKAAGKAIIILEHFFASKSFSSFLAMLCSRT
jgi:hypothetical protein